MDNVSPTVAADEYYHETFISLQFRIGQLLYDEIKNGWHSKATPDGPQMLNCRSIKYGWDGKTDS
jgi:hypothetical protein